MVGGGPSLVTPWLCRPLNDVGAVFVRVAIKRSYAETYDWYFLIFELENTVAENGPEDSSYFGPAKLHPSM
jgi:hypothetical protein